MKWLLTGGGGMVASHLSEFLLDKGEDVYVTVRWKEDLSRLEDYKEKITLILSLIRLGLLLLLWRKTL